MGKTVERNVSKKAAARAVEADEEAPTRQRVFVKSGKFGNVYGDFLKVDSARAAWVYIDKPRVPRAPKSGEQPREPKYEVTLLLPKGTPETKAFLRQANTMVEQMADGFFVGKASKKRPAEFEVVYDGDEREDLEQYPFYEGHWYIIARATVNKQPKLWRLLKKGKGEIIPQSELEAGMRCQAVVCPLFSQMGLSFQIHLLTLLKDDGVRFAGSRPSPEAYLDITEDEDAKEAREKKESAQKKAANKRKAAAEDLEEEDESSDDDDSEASEEDEEESEGDDVDESDDQEEIDETEEEEIDEEDSEEDSDEEDDNEENSDEEEDSEEDESEEESDDEESDDESDDDEVADEEEDPAPRKAKGRKGKKAAVAPSSSKKAKKGKGKKSHGRGFSALAGLDNVD